jgi:hypothetical protein
MEIFSLNKVARLLMTFAYRFDCNLLYAFNKQSCGVGSWEEMLERVEPGGN